MIEFSDVSIRYGKKTACENISFCAEDGLVTVLVGRNGCGKTSLLKAAIGAIPCEGRILVDGKDLATLSLKDRASLIAYMPQELPKTAFTVRELVECGLYASGSRDGAKSLILGADLAAYENTPVSRLSGGEKQRAYFAMLCAKDAGVILLDEPTSNLDTEYRRSVYDFARSQAALGKAVLVVLHHSSEIEKFADRVVKL